MTLVLSVASCAITAIILAALLVAWQAARMAAARGKHAVRNGPWMTRFTYGSRKMSLHERAFLAVAGLWALQSSAVVYFTAFRDSEGRWLNRRNNYRIEGGDIEARWWVVTAYKNFHFIPNQSKRYSYSTTSIHRQNGNVWTIRLSSKPQSENWIPLGDKRGLLMISLRLYNPGPAVYEHPDSIPLPQIIREP